MAARALASWTTLVANEPAPKAGRNRISLHLTNLKLSFMNYASLTTRIVICASVLRAHAIIPDSSLGLIEAKYSNEAQKLFIGTPSTTKLTNGTLLASFEFFSNGPDPVCMPGPIQTASMRAASAEIALQEKIEQLQLQPLRLPEDTTYVIASHDEGSTWTPDSVSQVSEMHFMTLQ